MRSRSVSLRELNATLGLAALVVALVVLPNPMEQSVRQRDQLQQTIRNEAERLNKVADEVAKLNLEEPSEDLQQIEQALREGAKALEERAGSSEEALAALAALEQRLQALQAERRRPRGGALGAGRPLAQDPATRRSGPVRPRATTRRPPRRCGGWPSSSTTCRTRSGRGWRARCARPASAPRGRIRALAQSLSQSGNALEQGGTGRGPGCDEPGRRPARTPLANCALAASASGRRPRPSRAAARQAELLSRRRAATRAPASKVNRASRASKANRVSRAAARASRARTASKARARASKVRAKPATSRGGSAAGTGHQPEPAIGGDLRPGVRQLAPGTTQRRPAVQPDRTRSTTPTPKTRSTTRPRSATARSTPAIRKRPSRASRTPTSLAGMKDLVKDYFSSLTLGDRGWGLGRNLDPSP